MSDNAALPPHTLRRFSSILVSGIDARGFLQGQLSFDMSRLTPQRMELACCSSAQGRVQAIVWMVERTDGFLLILPSDIVESTVARLRKFVLRAKVKIEPGAERFVVAGYATHADQAPPQTHHERDGVSIIAWPDGNRTLVIAPQGTPTSDNAAFDAEWRVADIRAALPQVYSQTHELFVAQMLNVDLLGGIGFEKGCYTGQEIIARMHFRGTVKRRMFAFRANCPSPAPGARIVSGETHAGDVVDAAATPEGCEVLAVVSLADLQKELRIADSGAVLRRLATPYDIPVTQ